VRSLLRPWQLALLLIAVCLGAAALWWWHRSAHPFDAAGLVECLPQEHAAHLYIDVDALRRAGIVDLLAGPKTSEEPEYRAFVDQTGFDYRRDLNAVAAAFAQGGVYFAVRGKFSWKQLTGYAAAQGGRCHDSICQMSGSTADRNISFYLVRPDVLALAVSREPRGATMIGPSQWRNPPRLSGDPIWISTPAFVFSDVNEVPAGTRAFFRPLAQAQSVTFSAGPQGTRMEVRLEAMCNSPAQAADLVKQYTQTTLLLNQMLERDHMKPNPNDLSGVLAAGVFTQQDQRVVGRWPIERGFIESLLSGKLD